MVLEATHAALCHHTTQRKSIAQLGISTTGRLSVAGAIELAAPRTLSTQHELLTKLDQVRLSGFVPYTKHSRSQQAHTYWLIQDQVAVEEVARLFAWTKPTVHNNSALSSC